MRGILIDWIVDVHKKFKLKMETLFLAVNLIDRICILTPIAKHRFQLLGITGLFVCAEAYTESDILNMEAEILKLLDFSIVHTSTLILIESYGVESKEPISVYLIR
jgi:cyclin B